MEQEGRNMSVVVRMEMPQNCFECILHCDGSFEDGNGYCRGIPPYQDYDCRPMEEMRPSWCPIICQLPEGHGRLVDADALKDYLVAEAASYDLTQGQMGILSEIIDMIDEQPTIVPAERSET